MGYRLRPQGRRGDKKYAGWWGVGLFSQGSFDRFPNLSWEFKQELVKASNNSLAQATWSSYRTAGRHIERCRKATGWRLELPLQEEDLLQLVVWMRRSRNLQSSSIENMVTALRKVV